MQPKSVESVVQFLDGEFNLKGVIWAKAVYDYSFLLEVTMDSYGLRLSIYEVMETTFVPAYSVLIDNFSFDEAKWLQLSTDYIDSIV